MALTQINPKTPKQKSNPLETLVTGLNIAGSVAGLAGKAMDIKSGLAENVKSGVPYTGSLLNSDPSIERGTSLFRIMNRKR